MRRLPANEIFSHFTVQFHITISSFACFPFPSIHHVFYIFCMIHFVSLINSKKTFSSHANKLNLTPNICFTPHSHTCYCKGTVHCFPLVRVLLAEKLIIPHFSTVLTLFTKMTFYIYVA